MIRAVLALIFVTIFVVTIGITIARLTVDGWTVIAAVCVGALALIAWTTPHHPQGP